MAKKGGSKKKKKTLSKKTVETGTISGRVNWFTERPRDWPPPPRRKKKGTYKPAAKA